MGIIDWLFGLPSFHQFEDSFTLKREGLWRVIRVALDRCRDKRQMVLLVTHFPSTFAELQQQMSDWNVEYQIAQRPIDNHWFQQLDGDDASVTLALSPILTDLVERKSSKQFTQPLAIIVCERHPAFQHDNAVEMFARKAPIPTQLGYFMSLDDALIQQTIGTASIGLLKQLGLSNRELITSHMVTRRLNKVLKRNAEKLPIDQPANSPEEWYELNAQ